MQTMVVGDLHGKYEIAERAIKWFNARPDDSKLIFVGDYLDSYDRSVADQVTTLSLVLGACSTHNNVIGLFGNHEMSYLHPLQRCSGYKGTTQFHVNHMKDVMEKELKYYTWAGQYLVTHAGVSQYYLDRIGKSLDEYLDEGKYCDVGYARGGHAPVGGSLWCDYWEEFEPIDNLPQVFGHTAYRPDDEYKGIVRYPNTYNYNIDCLDRVNEVLIIQDDGITATIEEI